MQQLQQQQIPASALQAGTNAERKHRAASTWCTSTTQVRFIHIYRLAIKLNQHPAHATVAKCSTMNQFPCTTWTCHSVSAYCRPPDSLLISFCIFVVLLQLTTPAFTNSFINLATHCSQQGPRPCQHPLNQAKHSFTAHLTPYQVTIWLYQAQFV